MSGAAARPLKDRLPTHDELLWPALKALRSLGNSGTITEHLTALISAENVPHHLAELTHGSSGRTELDYRLAWARTALKRRDFLENSARGVWNVTDVGESASEQDVRNATLKLRAREAKTHRKSISGAFAIAPELAVPEEDYDWRDNTLAILRELEPSAFERLCQRLLRESGFVEVNVTGRSGDGGIDGTGILQVSLVSFHVLFQCKRYAGSVGAGAVRDFRGAMVGRTDKGLLITTGSFTPDAKREATRDGAPPIELIDGVGLCDHLKRLELGVETRMVEEVAIRTEWFERL